MKHIQYYIRTFGLVWRASQGWALANALLVVVRGVMPAVLLWAVKIVVDVASRMIEVGQFDIERVVSSVALLAGVYLGNTIVSAAHTIVSEKHAHLLRKEISKKVHQKAVSVDYAFYEDPTNNNLVYRAITSGATRPIAFFYNMMSAFRACVTLSSLLWLLFSLHWGVPVALCLLCLPIVYAKIRASRRNFTLRKEQTTEERRAKYYNTVLTSKHYAKELRLFGLGDYFEKLYSTTIDSLHHRRARLLKRNAGREFWVMALAAVLFVGLFVLVVYLSVVGGVSIGALAMYLMALQRSYTALLDLQNAVVGIYDSNLFLRNFYDFLDKDVPTSGKKIRFTSLPEIRFEHVSFRYPNGTRDVLHDISFTVQPGETLAVVGANGSGKSTLVKLICGLLKPTEGRVVVGGVEGADISENVSAIFQDFVTYQATGEENIRMGDLTKSDGSVEDAARLAGVYERLMRKSKGFQTPLGGLFSGSEMLSEGEWQRLALARAFYANKPIILLDEPLSALDMFTVGELLNHFWEITRNRTAVIVSHRTQSLRIVDKILVLKDGTVGALGTLDEVKHLIPNT